MKYEKYIIFDFDFYYPGGGLNDIHYSCDSLEKAKEIFEQIKHPNTGIVQIVDRDTWEVLYDN